MLGSRCSADEAPKQVLRILFRVYDCAIKSKMCILTHFFPVGKQVTTENCNKIISSGSLNVREIFHVFECTQTSNTSVSRQRGQTITIFVVRLLRLLYDRCYFLQTCIISLTRNLCTFNYLFGEMRECFKRILKLSNHEISYAASRGMILSKVKFFRKWNQNCTLLRFL